jgi:hypothetical protein
MELIFKKSVSTYKKTHHITVTIFSPSWQLQFVWFEQQLKPTNLLAT